MNNPTDQQLLSNYAGTRSEEAFAELVRRHVDFVYSAALRTVRDAHLAEDVTQSVFVALSKNASQLTDRSVLSGWLHRTAQNLAANAVRTEVRRRAREQEAVAMNELLAHESDAAWENIAPHLDTALGELSEPDRDALLLRYFERKSAREMAQTLGTSKDAAQKRVSRAVERLRELFSKRNVTIGASGLVVMISTNAVQAAPVGLIVAISSALSLAGTAVQTSTVIAATKTIAMTTLQKTLITATIAIAAGVGIYEARRASNLENQMQAMRLEQSPMTDQIQKLEREREDSARQLAALREENERLSRNSSEVFKLRGEAGLLRRQLAEAIHPKDGTIEQSPVAVQHTAWKLREPRKIDELQNVGNETPEAAAETVLWAARSQSTNLVEMVYCPPEALTKAKNEGVSDILAMQLANQLLVKLRASARGDSQQVWLDGGNVTQFSQQSTTSGPNGRLATNTYAGVINFRLSGRDNFEDPASERHSDLLFTKIEGEWKLVIPGFSPETPEKKE